MAMGLSNSPYIFQAAMDITLRDLTWISCLCYIDIIVFSKSYEEHKVHLQQMFDRLRRVGMKLKSEN